MEDNKEHKLTDASQLHVSFPQRVYDLLKLCEEQGREDIISWMNEGTAFKVNNVAEFERELLPRYFNTFKYYTFTRALHSYGFTCERKGRQTGIYSHHSFNRNDPLSPTLIKRVTKKESKKAAAQNRNVAINPSSIETGNNRPSASRSMPTNDGTGIMFTSQHCASQQFPPLLDETRHKGDHGDTADAAFPAFDSRGVAEELVEKDEARLPLGSELTGIFDTSNSDEGGDSTDSTRSYPTSSNP